MKKNKKSYFACGPVSQFKIADMLYQFCLAGEKIIWVVAQDKKGNRKFEDYEDVLYEEVTGKDVKLFRDSVIDWLDNEYGYEVVKRKKIK
jgi:hypothetical protein